MTDRKETPTDFVAKVSVKLPDFWTEDPDLWFLHAEAAFRNAQITQSKTKFDHIEQKLPQKIMVSVCSLLGNPLRGFKGKACLLWQKVSKLIHHPGLGDRRPTTLMDTMLALLPEDEKPGCLFLGLFLERLPVKMRDHLVSREFKNPSEMAFYADSLWDARKAIPTDPLLATGSTSLSSPSRGRTQDHRSPSPNRCSQTPGPSNSECYFHQRFGPAANNCRPLTDSLAGNP